MPLARKRLKLPQPAAPQPEPDQTASFEALLDQGAAAEHYDLHLYVTGTTPRSALAIANIRSLCDEYLPGRYDLEVVDIYQQPAAAASAQIIAAPTLVKTSPSPIRRLVGDLSDRHKVLLGLNLIVPDRKPARGSKWIKV